MDRNLHIDTIILRKRTGIFRNAPFVFSRLYTVANGYCPCISLLARFLPKLSFQLER